MNTLRAIIIRHGPWLGCLIALIGTTMLDNAWHRGIVTEPSPDITPYADQQYLGVNLFNIQNEPDPAVVDQSFATAEQLGARYARIQMPWEDVEIHGRGDFEDRRNANVIQSAWLKYDRIMALADAHHIQLIVRIDRPPLWARANSAATPRFQNGLIENGDSTGPPDDYQDYANFVATVVTRYPQIRYIQLWNEPNLAYEWNWQFPDPEAFTDLLRRASTAARWANPTIVILFPSLSPTDGKEPRIAPMSELDFLARCYAAGAADFFEVMSAQAYGLGQPPDEHRYVRVRWSPLRPFAELDRPIDTRIDVSRIVMLREVMEAAGDSNTAVWVSEFGYNSAPESVPPERRFVWGPTVSEAQKGTYSAAQMARARQEWPWLGVMNLWMLRWGGPAADPANPTPYFAIIDRDFSPYAGFGILQTASQTPATIGAGTHAWGNPAIVQTAPQQWRISVHGTQIGIRGGTGTISVVIDDAPATPVTLTGGDDIIASRLSDSPHIVTITDLPTTPQALLVWRQQPWRWLFGALPITLTIGLGLALWRVFIRQS